jgi:hypothetical protein
MVAGPQANRMRFRKMSNYTVCRHDQPNATSTEQAFPILWSKVSLVLESFRKIEYTQNILLDSHRKYAQCRMSIIIRRRRLDSRALRTCLIRDKFRRWGQACCVYSECATPVGIRNCSTQGDEIMMVNLILTPSLGLSSLICRA